MHIVPHTLVPGGVLELSSTTYARSSKLAVVVGGGRGCVLKLEGEFTAIWIPLHGRLQLGTDALLHSEEVCVTEPEACHRAIGRGNALWIGILGTADAWRHALGRLLDEPGLERTLLPARHHADRDLRRRAVAVARAKESADLEVEAVLERICALQGGLVEAIERCPGRTHAQRRHVFARLQRVCNYLDANCHLELDNDALARLANYSPWHFIRAFRAAYGETPHAYLVRRRLERACRLLRASRLAISEVALASGFENRCAFSRLFRQRFGTTAGAMRRQAAR
ncbi:AraC family transcriptional regulator [Dokdonella sp.]|uniref:AraC family transcriptional regulator n=1 Tax=Dokdonella sp. TaxID=2291710 RepID=UPI0026141A9E|nr:AraC family transcriptional regulator [Dokdonella sp.]